MFSKQEKERQKWQVMIKKKKKKSSNFKLILKIPPFLKHCNSSNRTNGRIFFALKVGDQP